MDGEGLTGKGHKWTFRVGLIELFSILTTGMVSWVYPFVKSNQRVHFIFFLTREREREWEEAKGAGERESQADSQLSMEPDGGLDLTTLWS